MKFLTMLVLLPLAVCAHKHEETKVGDSRPLTKNETLAMQGIQARQAQLDAEQKALQADITEYIGSVCGETKIPVSECQVDASTKTVKRVPPPPPKTETPSKPSSQK